MGIGSTVVAVAERLRVDARGWLVLELDHHVYFAGRRKLIILETADGSIAGLLCAIECAALRVRHVVGPADEIHEQAEGQEKREQLQWNSLRHSYSYTFRYEGLGQSGLVVATRSRDCGSKARSF